MNMLPSSVPAVSASLASASSLPGSPNELWDEKPNALSVYLHHLAGYSEIEVDSVVRDHSYARPWNWKPENIYVKPVKKIFFNKLPDVTNERLISVEDVNVEEIKDEEVAAPYDFTRTRHLMDEFRRLANFARPEGNEINDDDWEEKIEKMLWSPVQHRIFSKVMRILSSERLARLAKTTCRMEPIFRRTSVDTAARRYRETLASTGWDWKITQWLHSLLFDHLPREYLAIYLDILQTLRLKIPQLIDRMMTVQPNINAKSGSITWETLGSLLKRSWDPVATCLNSNRPKKLPGNPILIVAPSGIGTSVSSRQHKWISQLGSLGMVVNVHVHLGMAVGRMTMMACMDQLVQATRAKVQDVRGDCPGRPIIIIGFNSGAALACQVAQIEHVTAVICLGFPFTTVEGNRGTPDDTLMDLRCPVMFVIGQNATLVRPDDLEDIRERMLVETSLVVVGTADDHLRISTTKKITEGITQSMVDRCILDEIGDFIASIVLQPHPLPLRSISLSAYESVRPVKKEPRKRKNSTSSSVDSESNYPNVKKSRPGTPVSSSVAPSGSNTAAPVLVPSRSVTMATQSSTVPVSGTGGGSSSVGTITTNPNQPSVQKRKPRFSNSQKNHFSDHIITTKHALQQSVSSGNGGITLNIGSLASLAPIGPIRLAPTTASQSTTTSLKGHTNSRSPVTFTKIPKIVQTNVAQSPLTKSKTVISTSNKGFSKVMCGNSKNINIIDKGTDGKMVNMLTSNQVRVSAPTASVLQNKSVANTTTSGALSALLQSGKSAIGTVGDPVAGRGIPTSSSSILTVNSNVHAASSSITTIAPTTKSKVTDIIDNGGKKNVIQSNSTISCTKYYPIDMPSGGVLTSTENSCNSTRRTPSPMLLPFTNKTPVTILPFSSRTKMAQKNAAKTVPKMSTYNNNLQKAQRAKLGQSISITKKNITNEIDDDLGNILDIPIIFAKEGDNLNVIEKAPPLPQIPNQKTMEAPIDKSVKKLGSGTKVVLISNKQDHNKTLNQPMQTTVRTPCHGQGLAQVILQSRAHNSAISIGTNWNGIQQHTAAHANSSTIKYTKIILAKRNCGTTTAYNTFDKNEQVILTKNVPKISGINNSTLHEKKEIKYAQVPIKISATNILDKLCNDSLEVEDAIKTNIIERKLHNISDIDSASESKNQCQSNVNTVQDFGKCDLITQTQSDEL